VIVCWSGDHCVSFLAMFTRATVVVTACLGLLLGGCYETDKPIITRDMAIEVPGLEGEILNTVGDRIVFVFDGQSVSYQGGTPQTDGSIEWEPCAFLIMPLRDALYWFQCGPEMKEDGRETYSLYLFNFDHSLRQLTDVYAPDLTEAEFGEFAAQYRVTVGSDANLSGSRDDILAFLMAHADVPLKEIDSN
jgi:hypothetical protein